MLGLLFGVQVGDEISVLDSAEAAYEVSKNGDAVAIPAEIEKRIRLWTAVYASYKLVGWYTIGSEVKQQHLSFHNVIEGFASNPLFVLFNAETSTFAHTDRLPLNVFRMELKDASKVFVDTAFQVETSTVEKVALDQIMKSTPNAGLTPLEAQNQTLLSSINTLNKKVQCIVRYLEGVKAGTIPVDPVLLRKAAKICNMLPTVDSSEFEHTFNSEISDALMTSYLSAVTKTLHSMNEVTDSYVSLFARRGGGIRDAGMPWSVGPGF